MYLHKLNALLRICLGFILITATGFFTLSQGLNPNALAGRGRISINAGWKFMRFAGLWYRNFGSIHP